MGGRYFYSPTPIPPSLFSLVLVEEVQGKELAVW